MTVEVSTTESFSNARVLPPIAALPSAGMQFFGHVKIDGATGPMTVKLRDRADVALWSTNARSQTGVASAEGFYASQGSRDGRTVARQHSALSSDRRFSNARSASDE